MRRGRNCAAALQVVSALPMRTVLLALPVAASTALALATLAIDHGLAAKAGEAAQSFGSDVISLRPGVRVIAGKSGSVNTLTEDDAQALRERLRGAKNVVATRIEDNVPTSFAGRSGVYRVFGVTPIWADVRQFGAERGQFLDQTDVDTSARVCVIGQTVARELFAGQEPVGQEVSINQVPFRVKGVLVSKGASPAEGDRDARIVVPITTFYNRLYRRLFVDQIVIQATSASHEALARLQAQIQTILRERHHISAGQTDDFTVRLPEKIAEESRGLSRSVLLLLLGLAVISAVVAALVIALVFQQAVRARRGEIGTRRALGATPSDILGQIWCEGLSASVLGGVLGVILGLVAAWALANWRQLAFGFDAVVAVVPLLLILVASLAGLFPAREA
ncbi:MAG: ABC transporter permease, partial [Planctomycetes bacterium]|nr:ABC transporter permease [Planctomycetota bacterium]